MEKEKQSEPPTSKKKKSQVERSREFRKRKKDYLSNLELEIKSLKQKVIALELENKTLKETIKNGGDRVPQKYSSQLQEYEDFFNKT